jgi:hypothetical protein
MTNTTFSFANVLNALSARKITAIAAATAASMMLAACGGASDSALDATAKAATSAASEASDAALPDSTAKAAASSSIFYGMNTHISNGGAYDQITPATMLAQLKDLGVKIVRNDVYSQTSANMVAKSAAVFAAGGVTMYPVVMAGSGYASEQDAYNAGYNIAKITAQSYNYKYFEVGNELEAKALAGNVDGIYAQDYDNAKFQKLRGSIRGLIAGIKAVNPSAKIILGGTWLHTGFFDMLKNGTQPDGSGGHPTVNWDITSWHWYSNAGDITHACGGTGCHDTLGILQGWGKPIWINEFGVRPDFGSTNQIAAYITGNTMMAQYYSIASKYNIQSIQQFELYDDSEGAYGLMQADGKALKAAFYAMKAFITNHPK